MIEIITPGIKNRITCSFCGAVLSYEKIDIRTHEHYTSLGVSYTQEYIECKSKLILEAKR